MVNLLFIMSGWPFRRRMFLYLVWLWLVCSHHESVSRFNQPLHLEDKDFCSICLHFLFCIYEAKLQHCNEPWFQTEAWVCQQSGEFCAPGSLRFHVTCFSVLNMAYTYKNYAPCVFSCRIWSRLVIKNHWKLFVGFTGKITPHSLNFFPFKHISNS